MFKGLLDKAPVAVLVSRVPDGEVLYANRKLSDMVGRSLTELIGSTNPNFHNDPSGRVLALDVLHALGRVENLEVQVKKADGTLLWVETFLEAINYKSEPAIFASYIDITEKKQSDGQRSEAQERLNEAIEAMSEGFVIFDAEDRLIKYNSMFRKMFAGAADLIDRKPTFDEWARACAKRGLVRDARSKEEAWTSERVRAHREANTTKEYQLKDGRWISIAEYRTKFGGTAGLRVDVTERKRVEAALRTSQARLKAQFNAIPIPTYSWQKIDDDFELVDFNASAAGITEGKISQLVGARASVLYSEEPEIVSFMHKAFDQQLTETHELKYALKTTGAVRDLRVTFGFGPPDLLVVHTEDITERKQAEEAARENSARTRGILENVADGVVTMTEDGLIESVNPAAERIFGYAVSEMVGNPVTMLMTGMDGKNHDRYLRQYVQTGKSGILGAGARELKARRKDGSTFPIGLAVSEMQSADRRIFIGSIRDITIRKQAERAIERKTALLKDTLDSMGQGLIVIDGTLTVLAANHRVIKMLRAPEGLLVEGADFGKFIEYAAARGDYGPGELEGIIAYQRSMALGAEAHTFDRTMPDGTHFEAQAIPRPTGGFVITYTDVTERIAAKEELRRSQSSLAIAQRIAHLGSWEMDIATGEGAWSDEMFRMYGYQPGEVKPSFEVVKAAAHPDDQETVIKKFRDACDPSVPDFDHEYRIVRNDGSERVVHSRWEMMRDDEGKPNKIVGVVHDITERVRAGESVREALLQAETANRSKSEFLANMSHELRTPLNAIIGFSQVLQDELKGPLGDPSYRQYVRDIHESGTLLLSLINDILDLSKIEAGKLELQDVKQNIPEIVGACRRIIDGRAKEAGLMLDTRLSDGLPHLQVDERALKQILLNLLSNAVKFTPEGGSIAVDARIDDDGCFAIIVSDTGIGIAPAEIHNALSNFGQVENYLTREKQGTGLGLPLSKSLAEAHGGTLELESELGRGTTVTVRFPAERVGEASVAMVRSREAGAA